MNISHFDIMWRLRDSFAHFCHQNYRFCEETWEINSNNIVYLCSSRLVPCYLLLFKIISIYNWAKVGTILLTVYSKMGGRSDPQNSKNLPRSAAEFGKWRRGIWQNLPRKTVGPIDQRVLHSVLLMLSALYTVYWRPSSSPYSSDKAERYHKTYSFMFACMLAGALLPTKTTIFGQILVIVQDSLPFRESVDLLVKLTYLYFMILRLVVKMCNWECGMKATA